MRHRLARSPSLFVVAVGLTVAACAPALREPPALSDLGPGQPTAVAEQVDRLLDEAAALYAVRDRESVRRAGEIWLEAALADEERIEGIVGAVRGEQENVPRSQHIEGAALDQSVGQARVSIEEALEVG